MGTITFDTLKFVETLEASGFTQPQARALSVAVREVQSNSDVATKQDIQVVKVELASVRSDLGTIRWILGFIGGGIVTLVIKALWPI